MPNLQQQWAIAQKEIADLNETRQRLIREVVELRELLGRYGDHTVECYAAASPRCVCSWTKMAQRLNIRTRML